MDFNHIDMKIQQNPRSYEDISKNIKSTSLIEDAAGISLRTGIAIRNTKIYQLQSSKEALAIVDMAAKEKQQERLANKEFSFYDIENINDDDYSEDLDCNASVNISPGGQRIVKEKARLKEAEDTANRTFGGQKVINIGYGYKSLILGSLEISEQTNYISLRTKIKPLIEKYLASNTSDSMENEINNFKILDPNGKPVEGLESEIRTVWREACATDNADFIVLVKPATWLQMSNYDDDNEDDDDYDREDVTSHY